MSENTTAPTVQSFRHKIRKFLFVANVRMTGVPGLTQDQQLENIDAAIELAETAVAQMKEMREIVVNRKTAFAALVDTDLDAELAKIIATKDDSES